MSHQTGESRETVEAHRIKEHSGKANSAKPSPSAPLRASSRQGPHATVFNTKGKLKLQLYQIFSLAQYFIIFTLYFKVHYLLLLAYICILSFLVDNWLSQNVALFSI